MGKCVLSLFPCQSLRKCFYGSTSSLPRSRITDVREKPHEHDSRQKLFKFQKQLPSSFLDTLRRFPFGCRSVIEGSFLETSPSLGGVPLLAKML
jgi:hypothetical protein